MDLNSKVSFENIKKGDRIPSYEVKMGRKTYFEYNKLVNEINPLHFDEKYAQQLGFKNIVVAGVYTFSFITRMIAEWIGEPGSIQSIEIKYNKPIYIDDVVTYSGTASKKYIKDNKKYIDCEISIENVEGAKLINATATIRLS